MNEVTAPPVSQSPRSAGRVSGSPLGWLRGEVDRLFDDFSFGSPSRSAFNFPLRMDILSPAVDFLDEGNAYRLSVELPGMKQEDIEIEYRDGVLTLSGEKKEESESKEGGCLISERRYGNFQRQISLPSDVDPDGIDAKFENGLLSLTLRKNEDAATRARKIKIG